MQNKAMTRIGRALLAGVVLGLLTAGLSACNTVKGVGQDVQRIGEGGQRIIDDAN